MLRAKQISNLSSSARSFFISGSRYSPADGSSGTTSEDETYFSGGQNARNEVLLKQKPSTLVSKNSAKTRTSISEDAQKGAVSHKAGVVENHVSLQQILPAPTSLENSSKNCMVNSVYPSPRIKPLNVKHSKRENFSQVHPNSSFDISSGSKPRSNDFHGSKQDGDKSGFVKGLKQGQYTTGKGSLAVNHNIFSDTSDERTTRQRSKARSYRFTSSSSANAHIADAGSTNVTRNFNKSQRDIKGAYAPNVVENVSHILQQFKWGPTTEDALRKLNYSMGAYQANQVLKQIQDYSAALGFFYWLKQQEGFRHDEHTYTTMVGILGHARKFGLINKFLDEMVKDGCTPNVVTYNRLIHSYGRANYLKEAINVFYKMQEEGCEPDRVTHCTLIDVHAKAGFLDVAMEMYGEMQEAGLYPDTFTYSVIINCLGKAGHLNSAHKLFCQMIDQGCVPNLVTYNIMIDLQAKARNYPMALKVYRDMQNAGLEPDKVTYSIVMEVLGHCGYLNEAEALFLEMQRKNWVPDETVYGLLVDMWGKSGNVEKAQEWYYSMINAGLRPNVPICNSLLGAFLRVYKLSDAYNLLQSMIQLGLNPSVQTYTLLLSSCTYSHSPHNVSFCGELMAITSHPAHTFLLSMPSAGPDGQNVRDHASKFFDLMHSEDRESKRGLVDAVVDFLHKSGLKEEARSVWEVAAQNNVYPDALKQKSSCYWLINLHVMSDGTAVTALSRTLAWFRQEMISSGIGPSRIDIVTGWGKRSRVTGSSLVREAVRELLHIFSFPFFTENGNSGCFVGRGEPLSRWLEQSYVERMHLL